MTGAGFNDTAPFLSGASGNGRLFFESDRSHQEDFWFMDRLGQPPRQVTFGSNREFIESVSVDGSTLAFAEVLEAGSLHLFDAKTGRRVQLTAENTRDVTPSLASNGLLVFARVPLNSGAPSRLSAIFAGMLGNRGLSGVRTLVRDGFAPLVSPDGRWLTYISRQTPGGPAQMNLLEIANAHTWDLGGVDKGSLTFMDFPWSWTERDGQWSGGSFVFVQTQPGLGSRIVRVEPPAMMSDCYPEATHQPDCKCVESI